MRRLKYGLLIGFAAILAVGIAERLNSRPLETSKSTWSQKLKDAAQNKLQQHLRERAENANFATSMNTAEMIAGLFDERVEATERYRHAYRLAKSGSPEAIEALKRYFKQASSSEKAAIAQLMGAWGNAEHKPWLWPLLEDPELDVRLGAIRALSSIGGDDVVERWDRAIRGDQASDAEKVAMIEGLGTIRSPFAYRVVMAQINARSDVRFTSALLDSLSRFPFTPETEQYFRNWDAAAGTPLEQRVAAMSSLAHSDERAVPFLLDTARTSTQWAVRAEAAWALSAQTVPHLADSLVELAASERNEIVRRRLLEAIVPQTDTPIEPLYGILVHEEDEAVRVAVFNALGAAAGRQPDQAQRFDDEAVPELLRLAVSENPVNLRMRAVFALRRAHTPGALEALGTIAGVKDERVAIAAAHGLSPD